MMAISPGLSRLVMIFVARSTRATATMPGGSPARPRNTGGITDGNFIESILPERPSVDGHVEARGVSWILRPAITAEHARRAARYHLNLRPGCENGRRRVLSDPSGRF